MEQLLQWAVKNGDAEKIKQEAEAIRRGEKTVDPKKFDPKIIDAILGKDDATLMKEALECIMDPEDTIENKEIAMDNFELLVENIDNAKNIENMKLWPNLIAQLSANEPAVRKNIAWICGTAVQNCPDAQEAFLRHGGLSPLLKLLRDDDDKSVCGKAQFALSGLLKHSPNAQDQFKKQDGPKVYADILERMDDIPTIRRIVFSLNILILENESLGVELLQYGIVAKLDNIMAKFTEEEDEDMVEKTLRTLYTLMDKVKGVPVPADLKEHILSAKNKFGADELGLTSPEWDALLAECK